jgi:hypothetical protein
MASKTELHPHKAVESARPTRWKRASLMWLERRIRVLRRDARRLRRRAFGRPGAQVGEPISLAHSIEHASRSLAVARELVSTARVTSAASARALAEQRVRTDIAHVARLLEDARDPTLVSPARLEGAVLELDRGLSSLDHEDRVARNHASR